MVSLLDSLSRVVCSLLSLYLLSGKPIYIYIYVCIFILFFNIYFILFELGGFKIILIVGKALISPFLGTSICAHT